MKRLVQRTLRHFGFELVRHDFTPDVTDEQNRIFAAARPYTLTSLERMLALSNAVDHVVKNAIPGDIVECGVWRGGSMIVTAMTLMARGDFSRSLYLYDTYEGMPAPTDADCSFDGISAEQQLAADPDKTGVACYASIEDVRRNLLATGYPPERIHFIPGKVEDTLPAAAPDTISLLRLDTDWYESTRHELKHLYPRLSPNGPLIIDDYGHWQGARKAVDEFLLMHPGLYLHRIDYTGRILIKP